MCKIKLFFENLDFILSLQTCGLIAFRDFKYFAHIKFEITKFIVDSFSECELIISIFYVIRLLKILNIKNSLSDVIFTFLKERLYRSIFLMRIFYNLWLKFMLKQKLLIFKGSLEFCLERTT